MRSAQLSLTHTLVILALIYLSSWIASAQQPSIPPGFLFATGPSYTSTDGHGTPQYPTVDLTFDLRKTDGTPVPVHPEELALFSQGQQVGACNGIRTFDRTGYGTSTVIALDASGALRALSPNAVNIAVFTVVHDGVKQDTTAVTTLAEDFFIDLPFHPGPRKWKANTALFPARGAVTHLYDGLLQATSLFTPTLPRRRILLVIVDGRDGGSQHTPLDLLARAKSLGIEIDTIAVNDKQTDALTVLQQLSIATGGTYVLAHNGDELDQMIALHLSAVRATPVAEFHLSHLSSDAPIAALQLRWLSGHLSTPAFVNLPHIVSSFSLPFSLPFSLTDPWILGFAACFLLGVGLFLFSLFLPKTSPHPAQQSGSDYSTAQARVTDSPAFAKVLPVSGRHASLQQPNYIETESERSKFEHARRFDASMQGPFARIVVRNNAFAGRIFPMSKAGFSIGALPGNDLALPGDLTISGHHLRLFWENATLTVEDNHSSNGTYLNRMRLPAGRHALKPGDEIGLGQTFLIVERS